MLLEQKDRRVVPRLRDFETTLELGELNNSKVRVPISSEDKFALYRRSEEFRNDPNVWNAGDLLSSAFVVGDFDAVNAAAQFILANRSAAPASLLSFARRISSAETPKARLSAVVGEDLARSIHSLRARLRNEPLNAIRWVELARLYTLNGDSKRAVRSMTVAAGLAPDSRFVVRSAARLFLHERDATTALRIIRRASGAKRDPWLLAAEIAVATASDNSPLFAKLGTQRNEDQNLTLFARTELASALATLDMENGKTRKARQLFRQSLASPNENSAAQVEWANRQIGGLEIRREMLEVPRSFEVNANVSLVEGNWDSAIRHGNEWLKDQPFSRRPAVFTSYVSSLVENYESAIAILRQSLALNPNDPSLINNLAFALASANKLDDALKTLNKIDVEHVSGLSAITLVATSGLVLFRSGFPERGRELYQRALAKAQAQGILKYKAFADLYLAREELMAGTPVAFETATRALTEAKKIDDRSVELVASQIDRLYRMKMSRSLAPQ